MNNFLSPLNQTYPSKKLIICIIFIILISLTLLLIFLELQFPIQSNQYDSNNKLRIESFYNRDFSTHNNILIIGSSHAGFINSTFVEEKIQSEINIDYRIFNLGKAADRPEERFQDIEKLIDIEPKLVIYGISYRDFPIIDSPDFMLSKIHLILSDLLNEGNDFVNPQLFTRYSIINNGFTPEPKTSDCFYQSNTPLIIYCPSFSFAATSIEELKRMHEPIKPGNFEGNKIALSKIIEKFNDTDTKVVLFVTPVHQVYIDKLSKDQKNSFDNLIIELESKYDYLNIYDFRHKYDDEFIWQTPSHIAISNGSIFDFDIYKMIESELK